MLYFFNNCFCNFIGDNDHQKHCGRLTVNNNTITSKKQRKSRTAFNNKQISELERRFIHQKYLTPADRDDIAQALDLSSAQVITWFQNRRAKLKRDREEMMADVTATKAVANLLTNYNGKNENIIP